MLLRLTPAQEQYLQITNTSIFMANIIAFAGDVTYLKEEQSMNRKHKSVYVYTHTHTHN